IDDIFVAYCNSLHAFRISRLQVKEISMNWLLPGSLVAPIAALFLLGLVPTRSANGAPRLLGWLTTLIAGLALLVSVAAGARVLAVGPVDYSFVQWNSPLPFCLGIHFDAVTAVMMTLVSFIGLIIAR